jgi:hypothetical protein
MVNAMADAGMGIECNPITNAGCSATAECDVNIDGTGTFVGFTCYDDSAAAALCATCDDQAPETTCKAGSTCFAVNAAGDSSCARYCCTDADCANGGSGHCLINDPSSGMGLFAPVAPTLGICVP